MTFGDMARRIDDLTQKAGGYRGAASLADAAEYMDSAARVLAQRCSFYDPSVVFTPVASQAVYQLNSLTVFSKKVVNPLSVVINGNSLMDARGCGRGLWSIAELTDRVSTWRATAAGTPTVAVDYGSNSLLLYPKPTQAVVDAGNNFVEALIVPGWIKSNGSYATSASALVTGSTWDTSATPAELEEDYHDAFCVLAALKAAKPLADSQAVWDILNAYSAELVEQLDLLGRRNRAAMSSVGSIKPSDRKAKYLRLG